VAAVLLRAEAQAAARDVAEAPRREAEVRDVAAVLRPEAGAQAGVARQPVARDAAVLRREARGAQALPSAAVFLPCRFRVLPPAP
jgi:hypothetical protein